MIVEKRLKLFQARRLFAKGIRFTPFFAYGRLINEQIGVISRTQYGYTVEKFETVKQATKAMDRALGRALKAKNPNNYLVFNFEKGKVKDMNHRDGKTIVRIVSDDQITINCVSIHETVIETWQKNYPIDPRA